MVVMVYVVGVGIVVYFFYVVFQCIQIKDQVRGLDFGFGYVGQGGNVIIDFIICEIGGDFLGGVYGVFFWVQGRWLRLILLLVMMMLICLLVNVLWFFRIVVSGMVLEGFIIMCRCFQISFIVLMILVFEVVQIWLIWLLMKCYVRFFSGISKLLVMVFGVLLVMIWLVLKL